MKSLLLSLAVVSGVAFAAGGNNEPVKRRNAMSTGTKLSTRLMANEPVSCACGGMFHVGDRVRARVANPSGSGLPRFAEGIVISGSDRADPPLFVSWAGWNKGNDGNGKTFCPRVGLSDNSGWYVHCDEVEIIQDPQAKIGGCLRKDNSSATGAREAFLFQRGLPTLMTKVGRDSCFSFPAPKRGVDYSIAINGTSVD